MSELINRDAAELFVATRDGVVGLQLDQGEPQVMPWTLYGRHVRRVVTDPKGVLLAAAVKDDGVWATAAAEPVRARGLDDGVDVRTLVASSGAIYAGASGGGLYRSDDGGRSFGRLDRFENPWSQDWTGLGEETPRVSAVVVRGDRVIAGIAAGGVLLSESRGDNFRKAGDGLPAGVLTLAAPEDDDDLVIAGTSDGLYQTTKLGTTGWRPAYRPQGRVAVTAIDIDPRDRSRLVIGAARGLVVAKPGSPAGADARLHRSDDGGASWRELDRAVLPVIRGVITAIVRLPGAPDRVFAGTSAGEVFESEDGGRSFFLSTCTLSGVLDLQPGNAR